MKNTLTFGVPFGSLVYKLNLQQQPFSPTCSAMNIMMSFSSLLYVIVFLAPVRIVYLLLNE